VRASPPQGARGGSRRGRRFSLSAGRPNPTPGTHAARPCTNGYSGVARVCALAPVRRVQPPLGRTDPAPGCLLHCDELLEPVAVGASALRASTATITGESVKAGPRPGWHGARMWLQSPQPKRCLIGLLAELSENASSGAFSVWGRIVRVCMNGARFGAGVGLGRCIRRYPPQRLSRDCGFLPELMRRRIRRAAGAALWPTL
jgi:hypothetical protein